MIGRRLLQLLPALILLSACSRTPKDQPEPAGIVNAYGTAAADYCQQLVTLPGDQVLVLASSEVNGPPALLALRIEAGGYTPSGSLSTLPPGIQGRFQTFGLQRIDNTLWTGFGSGNRLLAAGQLDENGSLARVVGLLLDSVRVIRDRYQCHGRALVAGAASDWLVAGHLFDDSRTDDLLVACFDRDGNPRWAKAWGTPQNEYLTDAASDGTGGLVAVGFDTQGRILILRIDSGGRLIHAQALASASWQLSSPRIQAQNDKYVIMAQASSNPGPRQAILLTELNTNLNPLRSQLLEAAGRLKPRALAPFGAGWAVAGAFEAASLDRGTDAFWLRLSSDWKPEFGTAFGGRGIDEATTLASTERGGVWLAGSTESFDPSADLFVVRLNDRNEARCHQRPLEFQGQGVDIASSTPRLTERSLNYFRRAAYDLSVSTNVARNRPPASQPCSNRAN